MSRQMLFNILLDPFKHITSWIGTDNGRFHSGKKPGGSWMSFGCRAIVAGTAVVQWKVLCRYRGATDTCTHAPTHAHTHIDTQAPITPPPPPCHHADHPPAHPHTPAHTHPPTPTHTHSSTHTPCDVHSQRCLDTSTGG